MPVFRVQVNYAFGASGKWSNVWHCSASDLSTVAVAFQSVGVPDLLDILHNECQLVSLLISSETDDTFITVPINASGTSSVTDELLPLFNSVKAFLLDDSLGRPDYKFIKGYLTELLQVNGNIEPAADTAIVTALGALIADMDGEGAPMVSADNDPYSSVSVQPAVQMRQMHRRRKKTVTP